MIAEHRLSQEKASQQQRKIADENRGGVNASSMGRTHERIPSSGAERDAHRPDMAKLSDASHRLHGGLDAKAAQSHLSNNLAPTTHSSHTRRPSGHNSSPASKTSNLYPPSSSQHGDRHTPLKGSSSSISDNKPIMHHPLLHHPATSLPNNSSSSALSSLQNFSHSSPAITSLSNMIHNSESMALGAGRYDHLEQHKVIKPDFDAKVKDASQTGSGVQGRINGANASSAHAHHHHHHNRMRLQPEAGDNRKRQRLNSGDNHFAPSGVAPGAMKAPKASPKQAKHPSNKNAAGMNLFGQQDPRKRGRLDISLI